MQICNITPSRRAHDAAWLAEMVAAYRGPIQRVEGFDVAAHRPARRDWTDPEYKLQRRRTRPADGPLPRAIAGLSVAEVDGVEILRSAAEVARMLRAQGLHITAPQVEFHAERKGIVLKQPVKACPYGNQPAATRQARDRAVLREEWT